MSADLMKSKFVRRPYVSQFKLLLPLGHTLERFFGFLKNKIRGRVFLRIFFVFVGMGSYRSFHNIWNISKTLPLLQFTAKSFRTSPEISYQWSSQMYFLWFLSLHFWRVLFVFVNMGSHGSKIFQKVARPSNHYRILWKFSWIFFPIGLTIVPFWIFEISSYWFLTDFLISSLYPQLSQLWETSIIWKKIDCRAKRSEIWASRVSVQCIQEAFDS